MSTSASEKTAPNALGSHISPMRFRRAAAFVPSGIAHVRVGTTIMTVSSLSIVSYAPPMVAMSISNSSRKGAEVLAADDCSIRLLRTGEELAAVDCNNIEKPGLTEFRCVVNARIPVGDHTMIVAQVTDLALSDGFPLVYWRRGIHPLCPSYAFTSSPKAFREFIALFQRSVLPKCEWTHAAHVAVGAYYAITEPDAAFECVKCGIIKYNDACGIENTATSGYHETLTMLWLAIVTAYVKGIDEPYAAARVAVDKFAEERDLHYLYYSFDVVRDATARRSWRPPDLPGPYELCREVINLRVFD
jgi:flavin reductase (DIM6/NTAB) family NADH-FMN oxidoreductase RutF